MTLGGFEDPETEDLLDRVRRGDESARGQLLARYRDRLRRMVAVRMDDRLSRRVDPSDVVQEAMAVALDRLPEYVRDRPISFYPWLRRIAWNRLVDLYRAHVMTDRRSVRREEPIGISDASAMQLAERLMARDSGPVKRVLREEMRARMRSTLAELRSEDREILLLRHLEELSSAECAAILEISESAARQRHVRAVRRLREVLGERT